MAPHPPCVALNRPASTPTSSASAQTASVYHHKTVDVRDVNLVHHTAVHCLPGPPHCCSLPTRPTTLLFTAYQAHHTAVHCLPGPPHCCSLPTRPTTLLFTAYQAHHTAVRCLPGPPHCCSLPTRPTTLLFTAYQAHHTAVRCLPGPPHCCSLPTRPTTLLFTAHLRHFHVEGPHGKSCCLCPPWQQQATEVVLIVMLPAGTRWPTLAPPPHTHTHTHIHPSSTVQLSPVHKSHSGPPQ